MEMVLFFIGFFILIKGAGWLVDGASVLAKKMGVSDLVVGLTIVSFGTSLPELLVNLFASIEGNTEIAIGNILGSNVANVLLILGITALISKIPVQRSTLLSEIPFALTASLLLGFLANANLFDSASSSLYLGRLDGIILLFFFLLFMLYIISLSKAEVKQETDHAVVPKTSKGSYIKIFIGLVCLYFGGLWVVDGATEIALYFGLSQSFIGLTVIAVGTSLPELVTSAVAAYRGNADIAIGNVIGSNIFNILWILGLSAVIKPLPFLLASNFDIVVIIGSSALLIICLIVGKRNVLQRWAGLLFVLCYIAYIYLLITRG